MNQTPPRRGCLRRLFTLFLTLGLLGSVAGAAGLYGIFWYYGQDLPDIRNVGDYRPSETTRIYSAEGFLIAELVGDDAVHRTVLRHDEIPDLMRNAIIAAEDKHFYEHAGVDYVGIVRAFLRNVRAGGMTQGASTITQQLVKNLVLSRERSLRRKIQEAMLAVQLEQNLTKDEILDIYLNEIFFGVRYYGVEEASRYYFGHSASELTLPEAALLAGLPQSPNNYNPYRNPEQALARRAYVLGRMFENNMIPEGEYRAALEAPLELADSETRDAWLNAFPAYVDAVIDEIEVLLPDEEIHGGGLEVYTALNTEWQQLAQQVVQEELREYDGRHGYHRPVTTVEPDAVADWRRRSAQEVASTGLRAGEDVRALILSSDDDATIMAIGNWTVTLDRTPESRMRPDPDVSWADTLPVGAVFTVRPAQTLPPAAMDAAVEPVLVRFVPSAEAVLVSMDHQTRAVVALTNGYEHARGGFQRALQARRQTGSTFKTFIYGAALQAGVLTAATVYQDQPFTFRIPGQPNWTPENYDGDYLGPMSVREALARSRNVIAVRALEQVTVPRAIEFSRTVGAQSPLVDNLTMALGSSEMPPIELANMFATVGSGGYLDTPWVVERVVSPQADDLFRRQTNPIQVVEPGLNWLIQSLLRSVVTEGTGGAASRVGHPVAGKTGTTNGARDAWFAGFSAQYTTVVWVGRDDNGELGRGESGGRAALPMWTSFMRQALDGEPVLELPPPPAELELVLIDPATGMRARPGREGAREEYFLPGSAPQSYAPEADERSADELLLNGGGAAEASGAGPQGTLDEF
jgi:penicillin-binding protein 1A